MGINQKIEIIQASRNDDYIKRLLRRYEINQEIKIN